MIISHNGNMVFRRWWEKEKRFVYLDMISFRNYYDDPIGGKVVASRGDEIDHQLGPFQPWTGKKDRVGVWVFVGDYLAGPYGRDLIIWDEKTLSLQAIEEGSNIYYSLLDVPFLESVVDGNLYDTQ